MLQSVGILAIATVSGATAALNIGAVPILWADGAQECCWMKGASTYFHIQWLKHYTTLVSPVLLKSDD